MTTDGGGWTLVGAWGNQSGYNMHSETAGYNATQVTGSYSTPRYSGGPAHYSSAVIQALFTDGEATYLSLVGRHNGGYILTRQTKDTPDPGYNAFQGIYYLNYMRDNGFTSVVAESTSNINPLPLASPGFSGATTPGWGCSSLSTSNCHHYLPGDITGGGRWLFRENLDNTPFSSYSSSSNVPSLLFIR